MKSAAATTDTDQDARAEVLKRLHASREELRRLLDPPPSVDSAGNPSSPIGGAQFPRSRTMRALTSNKGLTAVGAAAAGLLIARPAMALRLLRVLPASAFARMLLVRAITSLRGRS